jgi:hypothetical protein
MHFQVPRVLEVLGNMFQDPLFITQENVQEGIQNIAE